jgi:hypothetical protein
MKTVIRRLAKLEDQLGTGRGKPRLLLVLFEAGWGLALDMDTCIQILDECGFLPSVPVGLVNFMNIPKGMNAEQTERFFAGTRASGHRDTHKGVIAQRMP